MSDDGRDVIVSMIRQLADAEGSTIGVRHVCRACSAILSTAGATLYTAGDYLLCEPVYATDSVSRKIAELEMVLGFGPALSACEEEGIFVSVDLTDRASVYLWPTFVYAAVEMGVQAVSAVPVYIGLTLIGVLEIYRSTPEPLSADEAAKMLIFADEISSTIRGVLNGDATWDDGAQIFADDLYERWPKVYQATGVMAVQLEIDATQAFLLLRATAFVSGRMLTDVADDVIAGRLHIEFDPDDR